MTRIRVLVADDHAAVREGFKLLIGIHPDLDAVGEAADGEEARERALALRPDVVLMDVSMPRMDGAEATAAIKREAPEIKVLVLTRFAEACYVRRLIDAGADGYVLKQSAPAEVIAAIRAVAGGGDHLDAAIADRVVGRMPGGEATGAQEDGILTEREREVLRMTAAGLSSEEIGSELGADADAVLAERDRGMGKLGLRSRIDLARYARAEGWLD